jgi:hypothetical protein
MQRVSGAIVKLPEVNSQNPNDDTEVPVSIIGHFYAMQPAQRRIRSLVNQRGQQGGMGGPPPQRRQLIINTFKIMPTPPNSGHF